MVIIRAARDGISFFDSLIFSFAIKDRKLRTSVQNRWKLTPTPLSNLTYSPPTPLSVRTHHKFQKIQCFFTKKCGRPHLEPLVRKMSALDKPPRSADVLNFFLYLILTKETTWQEVTVKSGIFMSRIFCFNFKNRVFDSLSKILPKQLTILKCELNF